MCSPTPTSGTLNTATSKPVDEAPTRFAVGDEIEIRVRIVEINLPGSQYTYCVTSSAGMHHWMTGATLAAGRLVATRPLAVGDSVTLVGGAPVLGWPRTIEALSNGEAWLRGPNGFHGTYTLAKLVRA